MSFSPRQFRSLAVRAARSASDKKAVDVKLLDLKRTPGAIADYVLILSANSQVHLRTLREAVEEALEEEGVRPLRHDGLRSGHWAALDYGGLLVHVFREESRQFYSLERLWENTRVVDWEKPRARRRRPELRAR